MNSVCVVQLFIVLCLSILQDIVHFTGEDSWRDTREGKERGGRYVVFGGGGEAKSRISQTPPVFAICRQFQAKRQWIGSGAEERSAINANRMIVRRSSSREIVGTFGATLRFLSAVAR